MRKGILQAAWRERRDGDIFLSIPSVGATENLLLACALGSGTVTLHGAAREPEITDLSGFSERRAQISGARERVSSPSAGPISSNGATYTILPDRIETATYLCMAAGCGGEVELQRCDGRLLAPVIERLREAGCKIRCGGSELVLKSSGKLTAVSPVTTAPYPGFPTDAQAILMAAVLRAKGESVFQELCLNGAFCMCRSCKARGGYRAFGKNGARAGRSHLHGAMLRAEDLRGAAALITAGLLAEGESEVLGLSHLARGYENLEQNLKNLGAAIKSVDIPAPFVYNT